jgi:hypothetical protein
VSNSYDLLSIFGDKFLPFDEIDSRLEFVPGRSSKSTNLLIKGTDSTTLLYNLKSIVMKYRFNALAPTFLICRAIDILIDFYVQQEDGSSPQLATVNKYDLAVILFDTEQKNDKLKTCIAEVIHTRLTRSLPTWILLTKPTLAAHVQEYSPALEEYFRSFSVITMDSKSVSTTQATENKKSATSFSLT